MMYRAPGASWRQTELMNEADWMDSVVRFLITDPESVILPPAEKSFLKSAYYAGWTDRRAAAELVVTFGWRHDDVPWLMRKE